MPIVLFYLISLFNYQEIGGSASALLISSVGNNSYIATSTNPAILSQLNKNSAGIIYSSPYNINLIQYTRLTANYKNLGINISRLGQSGYQEYNFSISAGFNLKPELSYGLVIKGLYLDLAEYGQTLIPALNFGISYHINKMQFGAVLENINNPQTNIGDNIHWAIIAGALFEPVEDFILGFDIRKSNQDQNVAFGSELKPLPNLSFRLGTKTGPLIISGGIGFSFKNLQFDYTLKYHTRLKDTSVFSLSYFW